MATIADVVRAAQKVMEAKQATDGLQEELAQLNERRSSVIARGQAAQIALDAAKAELKAAAAAWS